MTYGQQCACIWAISLVVHAVVIGILTAATSALFLTDMPYRDALSVVWMLGFGAYILIGPVLIYHRIEDIWNG